MKKIYITPIVEIEEIECEQMMAGSTGGQAGSHQNIGDGDGDGNKDDDVDGTDPDDEYGQGAKGGTFEFHADFEGF